MIAFFAVSIANAQFTVMLVDDDQNGAEADPIVTALDNWGGVYTYHSTEVSGIPTYDDISSFDLVMWYTGNDGLSLRLWDVSDTTGVGSGAVKFNDALTQYYNAGGVIWIDGLDFLYDLEYATPTDFTSGDFVYDILGITQYTSQSHQDDGVYSDGVEQMDIATSNTLTTVDPITWSFSTLHNADGLIIRDDATALYKMGPIAYDLAGQITAFYRNNIITSGLRLGKISPQTDLDLLVSEMITAADDGSFPAAVSVNEISKLSLNIYPNPVTETATINLSEINTASELMIFDNMGRNVYSQALNASQENVTINVSDLASGLYHINITSNNSIFTTKFSVVK